MRNLQTFVALWSLALCCWLAPNGAFAQCFEFDFYQQPIGTASTAQTYPEINGTNLPNNGPPTPMTIMSISVNDPVASPCIESLTSDYTVGGTCVAGLVLMPGDSCTVSVSFSPRAVGPRNAIVTIRSTFGGQDFALRGTGVTSTFARPIVPVVEYVNASLNEYFITSAPAEIAALDAGAIKGWVRTGASFNGFQSDPNISPVCRWYAVTRTADSHWYFGTGYHCGWLAIELYSSALVEYVEEDPDVFTFVGPSSLEGWCPYGTIQLYGLYDGIIGHRYTTDPAIRTNMIAEGWVAEGVGPGVFACVSQ